MNREKAKALLPIITAYANGETIQQFVGEGNGDNGWRADFNPSWSASAEHYRIKPKPRTFYGTIHADGYVACFDSAERRDKVWPARPEHAKIKLVEVLD